MSPQSDGKALEFAKRLLLWQWLRRKRNPDATPGSAGKLHGVISSNGIDLDSLEEMMNRRLRSIWVRHASFIVALVVALLIGLMSYTIFLSTSATDLRIAVGPIGSDDVRFVSALQRRLKADDADFDIHPVIMQGPVSVDDIGDAPPFDLAVVRGNMKLSSDWPVVAILRRDVVALMVPPVSDDEKPEARIEKVPDLFGKHIAVVTDADGGSEVLETVLRHYGVPIGAVTVSHLTIPELADAVADNGIDAVLVAGSQTGSIIENTVRALSQDNAGPTFIPIGQAKGISRRTPPYEEIEVPAGTFGGAPPMPAEDLTTLSFPIYLVARKTLKEDQVAAFSRELYGMRKTLAHELPGAVSLESPSTEKDASVLVHPGTADYLGDNTKNFFEKWGDQIFYGLLVFPIVGSGLAGLAGYLRADRSTKRLRKLHRLLHLVRKARTVTSIHELDALQDEADAILSEIVHQCERGQMDEIGLATFTLALDQARTALSEQRSLLMLRPGEVPAQRGQPRSAGEQAAE